MKKRLIAVAVCAVLLAALGLGRPYVSERGRTYDLYFREADLEAVPGADALRAEKLYIGDEGDLSARQLAEQLVTALLAGPTDPTLTGVIPAETELLSLELNGAVATVDLSSRYRLLSGVALSLADYAITLTLTQLPEISVVNITVRGQQLAYRDRQNFTAGDVLFSTNEDVISSVAATLYLLDEDGRLAPREMTLDLYEGDTQVGAVVRALLAATEDEQLRSPLPEGFQVTSVRLDEDTCYVDLPTAALPGMGEEPDMTRALRALADSLLSLRAVAEVRYLVDGEYAALYGAAPVMEPYTAADRPPGGLPAQRPGRRRTRKTAESAGPALSAAIHQRGPWRPPAMSRRTAAPRRRRPGSPSGPPPGPPGPCGGCG